MKIGILTYHRVINYGAFMQAYSLFKTLKRRIGKNAEIEVIDYVTKEHIVLYGGIFAKAIKEGNWDKVKQFREFYKVQKRLHTTKEKLIGTSEIASRAMSRQRYDVIIVGSDEVWRDPNSVYWLANVECPVKMSYAASSRIIFAKLTQEQRDNVKNALETFQYIGVRDVVTKNEIERLLNRKVYLNCDPAFLMDIKFDKEKFRKEFYEKYNIPTGYKLIGVMLDGKDDIIKLVKQVYGEKYKFIALYQSSKEVDLNVIGISPFEWVQTIYCMDNLVTSFFHGVVYALKCNTNFVAVDYLQKNTSKIYDLLERENLLEHYMDGNEVRRKKQQFKEILENCKVQNPNYGAVIKNQRKNFASFDKILRSYVNQ